MLDPNSLNQLQQIRQDLRTARNQFEATVRGSLGRFGFAKLDDGRDAFLNPEQMAKVFPGDRVLIEVSEDKKGRLTGKVISLVSSELKYVTGKTVTKGPALFVDTDTPGLQRWLFVPPKHRKQLKKADTYVLAKVLKHPIEDGKAQVEISRVIGTEDTVGIEAQYCISKYNLRVREKASLAEDAMKAHLETEAGKRKSLDTLPFFSIDAESTRDIDDALHCEALEEGWRLSVAVADPSSFVEPGSAVEQVALKRSQTLYFPGKTLNMLPEKLANQWASLVAGKPRLALVCHMTVQSDGSISDFEFEEATVKIAQRLSYEQASETLPTGDSPHPFIACAEALKHWRREHSLLGSRRQDYRISINSETGRIAAIAPEENTLAHEWVESAMVAANRCAADFLAEKLPKALYMAHAGFRTERLGQIEQILTEQLPELGDLKLAQLADFQTLYRNLQSFDGDLPLHAIANRLLIKGNLSSLPAEHFGMGLARYTTFTSPIRRYVDYHNHRLIRAVLTGKKPPLLSEGQIEKLQESLRNGRQAVLDAERWMKTRHAASQVGKCCQGEIVQTNGSGFTVRTHEEGLEGYVNLAEHPDKFRFDSTYFQHVSAKTSYRLEQRVEVVIQEIDVRQRQLLFSLKEEQTTVSTQQETS